MPSDRSVNYSSSSFEALDVAEVAGFEEDTGLLLEEDEEDFLLDDDAGLLLAEEAGFVVFGFCDAVVGTAELAGAVF